MTRVRRITSSGDWTFGSGRAGYANDSESVAQRVKTRLLSFEMDWFLDLEHGMPWFQMTEKPASLARIETEIKTCILETDGVARIIDYAQRFDPETRRLQIEAGVVDIYDNEINIEVTR